MTRQQKMLERRERIIGWRKAGFLLTEIAEAERVHARTVSHHLQAAGMTGVQVVRGPDVRSVVVQMEAESRASVYPDKERQNWIRRMLGLEAVP